MMVTMEWGVLVLLILARSTWADNAVDSTDYSSNCLKLKSQESLDLDGIMGKWYVVEVLDHNRGETSGQMGTARVVVDSCPIIKLKPDDGNILRLLWSEEAGDLEYTFEVPNRARGPGHWVSTALQNGTLTQKLYSQFTGTVHVMKAVGNHMVLTFCSGSQDSQLYSVLMSREHILQKSNIKGVHNLLERRNLNLVSIRETCAKGASSSTTGSLLVLGLCWLVSVRFLQTSWFTFNSDALSL